MAARRGALLSIGLPMLGALSLAGAILSVTITSRVPPARHPDVLPPMQPPGCERLIGAVGLVEAASEQIAVASAVAGVVRIMNAASGVTVRRGDPLFAVDDRVARATLDIRHAAVAGAQASLVEAQTSLADQREQLARSERLNQVSGTVSISEDTLMRRRYAAAAADARARTAQASLNSATAELGAAEVELDRLTVRAPLDGTILQTNLRVGEFAPAGSASPPLVVMGQLDPLHVRTDIDEADVPRFMPGLPAWASPRGDGSRRVALRPVRIDPFVVPKASLTGTGAERVDTRVLHVVYAFDRAELAAYPGQLMDVFITARPDTEGQAFLAETKPATPTVAKADCRHGAG